MRLVFYIRVPNKKIFLKSQHRINSWITSNAAASISLSSLSDVSSDPEPGKEDIIEMGNPDDISSVHSEGLDVAHSVGSEEHRLDMRYKKVNINLPWINPHARMTMSIM